MPKFGKEEIKNLTEVIESGVFCDKRGGFMDGLRMRALLAEIDALRKLVDARAPDPSVTPLSK